MKTLMISIALLAASFVKAPATPTLPTDEPTLHALTVGITHVSQRTGTLYVGLQSEESSLHDKFIRKTRVQVTASGELQVTFGNLPAGRYAVKVFQDLNDNQKLDYVDQMPTEPFGFSNVTTLLGLPTFERCAITLDAPKTIAIALLGN